MTDDIENVEWFLESLVRDEELVKKYLDKRFDIYMFERVLNKRFGYITCPKCKKIKPYYYFIHRGSFENRNYLKCLCGERWDTLFPVKDMITEDKYFREKYRGKKK